MKVEDALTRYVDLASRSQLLDEETKYIVERIESARGAREIKEAAQTLGPWSSWPVRRRRAFADLLMQARSKRW